MTPCPRAGAQAALAATAEFAAAPTSASSTTLWSTDNGVFRWFGLARAQSAEGDRDSAVHRMKYQPPQGISPGAAHQRGDAAVGRSMNEITEQHPRCRLSRRRCPTPSRGCCRFGPRPGHRAGLADRQRLQHQPRSRLPVHRARSAARGGSVAAGTGAGGTRPSWAPHARSISPTACDRQARSKITAADVLIAGTHREQYEFFAVSARSARCQSLDDLDTGAGDREFLVEGRTPGASTVVGDLSAEMRRASWRASLSASSTSMPSATMPESASRRTRHRSRPRRREGDDIGGSQHRYICADVLA